MLKSSIGISHINAHFNLLKLSIITPVLLSVSSVSLTHELFHYLLSSDKSQQFLEIDEIIILCVPQGVLERFSQIEPSILFSVEAVMYNGKVHDHLVKLSQVVAGLTNLKKVVIIPFVHKKSEIDISSIPNR